ncbi:MAG: hypothetical protein CME70_11650 [Halobacteriovorax sp.]|nr:hypothetical protein [Halobacteriovorax sp.]|tara:strand:+ start:29056 stop:29529 length:474 start_codon:yes stop_codon:yes gene_type:complete
MKNIILVLFLFLFMPSSKADELKMVGTALAEFSIFKIDIYQISYFKGKNGKEELHLDYKREVKKKYSIMGWEEGLEPFLKKNPEHKDKYNWIINQVVDLKEGDLYVIRKENTKVSMLKNGKLVGEIDDKIIASMVFEPWLGEVPVDKDLKKKLLSLN